MPGNRNIRRFEETMARQIGLGMLLLALITLLSGCMYRGEQQAGPVSYMDSVDRVQRALDRFQEREGILPIITAGEETPRYEKYRIDLDRLKRLGYLDEIPSAAFEKGGSVYFLVINEEVDPAVKVLDLPTVQKVNDVQRSVTAYRSSHGGRLPGEEAGRRIRGCIRSIFRSSGPRTMNRSAYTPAKRCPTLWTPRARYMWTMPLT